MKAIVYDAPRSFFYRDAVEPSVEDDEVLIHVKACGLCGTDLHIHEGEFNPSFPLIPGHEFTGEVAGVGKAVRGWQAGAEADSTAGEASMCAARTWSPTAFR